MFILTCLLRTGTCTWRVLCDTKMAQPVWQGKGQLAQLTHPLAAGSCTWSLRRATMQASCQHAAVALQVQHSINIAPTAAAVSGQACWT